MSAMKEFFELAAKDERIAFEVEHSVREALEQFVRDKGLMAEASKVIRDALRKTAEAHVVKFSSIEELSPEELKAVSGGSAGCGCYQSLASSLSYMSDCMERKDPVAWM